MNIQEFMKLKDSEKGDYTNRTYPCGDKTEFYDYDIKVFDNWESNWCCEMCNTIEGKTIGTSDTREPKFCFKCYEEVNEDSEFIKE